MKTNIMNLDKFNQGNYDLIYLIREENNESIPLPLEDLLSKDNNLTFDTILKSNISLKPRKMIVELILSEKSNNRKINVLAKKSSKEVANEKAEKIALIFATKEVNGKHKQFVKRMILSLEEFNTYKTNGIENKITSSKDKAELTLDLYASNNESNKTFEIAIKTAEAISFSKYLVNEPANFMTPSKLAEEAKRVGNKNGIDVEIKTQDEIESLKMDAFLSVARASSQEPHLIVMRYMNNKDSDEIFGMVGKGVTYDSGGLAIKPAKGMVTMHADMGGSAAVIGAINLLASTNAKVNVVAVVAACENMIAGNAFRNGDIISSMSGKNIEIINTDAEGRLTLADAIWYAHSQEKVSRIVDIATLTGAVLAALGNNISGVVSDDDLFYSILENASEESGDKVWRLPCDEDLAKCNESKRADIKNASACGAGTTTAGLFLRAFANQVPWTHLDIAGTAYGSENDFNPDGASGVGTELLANAVESYFKQL